jgi:hypothetical protein
LLRQSVFGRLAGYEDVNDAERLYRDPAKDAGCPSRLHRDGFDAHLLGDVLNHLDQEARSDRKIQLPSH